MQALNGRALCATVALLAAFLVASSASGEGIYRWVDAEGNVVFGNRPPGGGTEVDLSESDRVRRPPPPKNPLDLREKPDDMPASEWFELEDRRLERADRMRKVREMQERRYREDVGETARRRRVAEGAAGQADGLRELGIQGSNDEKPAWRDDAWCQKHYNRSCAELDNWRQGVVASCEQQNLSRDCSDPSYIDRHRPLSNSRKRQDHQLEKYLRQQRKR